MDGRPALLGEGLRAFLRAGVASGITMSLQFGTNWPGVTERAGNVAGPPLASGLMVAFVVAGPPTPRRPMGGRGAETRATRRAGVALRAAPIPLQILAGDLHGLDTLDRQPAKRLRRWRGS